MKQINLFNQPEEFKPEPKPWTMAWYDLKGYDQGTDKAIAEVSG